MENRLAIGIDLGMINSRVAVYRNNRIDVLENELGCRATPSYVTFTENVVLTGPEAIDAASRYPKTTIFGTKRLIGQKIRGKRIKEYIKKLPFPVVNQLGTPKIHIGGNNVQSREYCPEVISAYLLQRMKKIGTTRTNAILTRAVVTVPAHFNNLQRQATKNAAIIAGFETVNLINEPTAAALAFWYEHRVNLGHTILVYCFGGGSFGVSVVKTEQNACKVIATRSDSHIGGVDIDSNTTNHLKSDFKTKLNKESNKNNCHRGPSRIFEEAHTSIRLERKRKAFLDRTIGLITECLGDCELRKKDIDKVLLVGGFSIIPKVQELVTDYFGRSIIVQEVNTDEAAVSGAAIYARYLANPDEGDLKSLIDVTTFSTGTDVEDDRMDIVIARNTLLPVKVLRSYATTDDNQCKMYFPIYQGQSHIATENFKVGEFTLRGLTKAPADKIVVKVCFQIDIDGILTVSAWEKRSKKRKQLVSDSKGDSLTTDEIEEHICNLNLNSSWIKKHSRFVNERNELQALLIKALEYAETPGIINRDLVLDWHNNISEFLESATVSDLERVIDYTADLRILISYSV